MPSTLPRRFPTTLTVTLTTTSMVLLAACGGSSGSTSGSGKTTTATVMVGDVLPFTGDLSTFGPSLDKASSMGATLVNEALKTDGITDVKVDVVGSEDDQTASAAGVEAATKLVQSQKATVLIGSMSSGVTTAIAQSVAIPNDVVMITPTSSDPSITELADNGLVFRIYPPDTLQARALAQAMADTYGKTALVNVGGRNDAFGSALTREFAAQWKAQGGRIGQTVLYNPTAATFDTEAAQLASGTPDAWMIADFPTTFEKMGPALVRTGRWSPAKTFMTEAMQSTDALAKIGAPATTGLRGTAGSGKGGAAPRGVPGRVHQAQRGRHLHRLRGHGVRRDRHGGAGRGEGEVGQGRRHQEGAAHGVDVRWPEVHLAAAAGGHQVDPRRHRHPVRRRLGPDRVRRQGRPQAEQLRGLGIQGHEDHDAARLLVRRPEVQRFRDDTAWQDLAGYVRAVRAGSRIEVSGTTASAPDGTPLHPGDVHGQTLEAITRCLDAVTGLGGSVADVVRTRVLLLAGTDWRAAARAHREVFAEHPPANTMLFVAG